VKKTSKSPSALRKRSERRLREKTEEKDEVEIGHDTQRLFHELQVHQIELELQNEELNRANSAAEAALEKYTDLYDFAPVGYFSLDESGQMAELNMAGAVLLGVERSRLTGRRFQLFVAPTSRRAFQVFLDAIFSGTGRQYCEAELLKEAGGAFWAELAGTSAPAAEGAPRLSRIVVSDISARKLAELEHKRIGVLAATNRDLQKEIALRRASEAELKKSEERFRNLLYQSRQLEKRLRNMTHEMLKAQEDQRKKISRELHDEVSQILLSINVRLAIFAKIAATDPGGVRRALGPMRRIVDKAVRIVHRFARELRPAMLDDLGLIPTLRSYIDDIPKQHGITFKLRADAAIESLDNDGRTVLYRIAQEALTNVVKHANASFVSIRLTRTPAGVSLEVADNGRSFDVRHISTSKWQNRLGLTGMRERVEMVGGEFTIASEPGKGTTIGAEVPLRPVNRKRSKVPSAALLASTA
jgi:PAS domain S-box-containing protein